MQYAKITENYFWSYGHKKNILMKTGQLKTMKIKTYLSNVGLEPMTLGLRVRCSIDRANGATYTTPDFVP